jgi:hypothetical protein
VDPALFNSNKSGVFWVKEKRTLPVAFKIFVGTVIWILFFYLLLVQFSVSVKYMYTSLPVIVSTSLPDNGKAKQHQACIYWYY